MKSIIYFLAVLLFFSCKPREQKINPEDIKGSWAASEAVMFTLALVGVVRWKGKAHQRNTKQW